MITIQTTMSPERRCATCNRCVALWSHHVDLVATPWLPVWQRVLFKISVLVFQCLASQAPSYLADNCQLIYDTHPHRLCTSDSLTCAVRHTWNTYGNRCFAAAEPRVWILCRL